MLRWIAERYGGRVIDRGLLFTLVVVFGLAAVYAACSGDGASESGGTSSQVCVHAPPDDPAARQAMVSALPTNDAGLPIVTMTTATLPPGVAVALVYDKNLDDPVARWSDCMGLVSTCRLACGAITACIDEIDPCPDNKGGGACCPPACNQAFHARLAAGDSENTAITNSYAAGDCVDGFTAEMGGVSP